jgi:hypothetical protein
MNVCKEGIANNDGHIRPPKDIATPAVDLGISVHTCVGDVIVGFSLVRHRNIVTADVVLFQRH